MALKEDKKPRRWPPDVMLAETGNAKRLYDRICLQKDTVVKRMANGKAVLGYRKPTILGGETSKIDTEIIALKESAIGLYQSKDAVVYVVMVDLNKFAAEALKDREHLWEGVEETPERMLSVIYDLFPKTKPTGVKIKTNIAELTADELRHVLKRRELVEETSVNHAVPSAKISLEEIKAAHDPVVIAREKLLEEQKTVS